MYKKEIKNSYNAEKQVEQKEKKKRNYDLVTFSNAEGLVIKSIGVSVPIIEGTMFDKKAILEVALRHFKRKVKDSGKLEAFRDNQEFTKKSVVSRKIKKDAIRRQHMENINSN